ncbi:MAG: VWA domain-containing protein [Planctomycetes bacterium]|nr:VWA domain-containing protein [Planctomycetota bacterium]
MRLSKFAVLSLVLVGCMSCANELQAPMDPGGSPFPVALTGAAAGVPEGARGAVTLGKDAFRFRPWSYGNTAEDANEHLSISMTGGRLGGNFAGVGQGLDLNVYLRRSGSVPLAGFGLDWNAESAYQFGSNNYLTVLNTRVRGLPVPAPPLSPQIGATYQFGSPGAVVPGLVGLAEELWVIPREAPLTGVAELKAQIRALEIRSGALPVFAKGAFRSQEPDPTRTSDKVQPGSGALMGRFKDGFKPVPLRHTDVAARIDGTVSAVTVVQQFHNPYTDKIEAHYVFPLPEDAGVTGFTMTVGERKIRAIIRERKEAERIYKEARRSGVVAALLEQHRPNVFRQKVANIEPGKQIDVSITYWHTVERRDGSFEWVFPMVVGPRFNPPHVTDGIGAVPADENVGSGQPVDVHYLKPGERSGHDISVAVEVNARIPLASIASPTHEISVHRVAEGRAVVTLKDGATIPNRDLVLRWRPRREDVRGAVFTATADKQEGGHLLLMIEPPMDSPMRRDLDLVFVLDCSGSMNGEPLRQMIAAAVHAIGSLGPRDTFQVVRFSDEAALLGDKPLAATAANKARVCRELRQVSASGGTMMMRGLEAALALPRQQGRQRYYVFMTDGLIGNEEEVFRRVGRGLGDARIFSFGIGSSPNRFLLERLARLGAGAAAYVGSGDDAVSTMTRFLDRAQRPVLTDLELDWGGAEVLDVQPSRLPDLIPGRGLSITARFRGRLAGPIRVSGRQNGVLKEITVAVQRDGHGNCDNPGLARLWARACIADIHERQRRDLVNKATVREEVRRLALDYGLLSPYTAFIAVDSRSRTAGDHGITLPVPVLTPKGVSYSTTVKER